jgi:hypothetical protein
MRSYAGFTQEEKEQVYSLARAGVPDEVICRRYDIDEDFLLRVIDDVFVNLQEKRGYKGICCKNDFLRGWYDAQDEKDEQQKQVRKDCFTANLPARVVVVGFIFWGEESIWVSWILAGKGYAKIPWCHW